ncbi:hypothetical protein NP493_223g02003 [Ridgeia piscesae]|uniref:Uncharacterized protein n=1 Tax=Ridgeia piscesae TaxID=27915 RepID=A0AAD9P0B3_RIDPI|nr:hypothetical protein NP493_223g02003 [Ridgeia piscesae]
MFQFRPVRPRLFHTSEVDPEVVPGGQVQAGDPEVGAVFKRRSLRQRWQHRMLGRLQPTPHTATASLESLPTRRCHQLAEQQEVAQRGGQGRETQPQSPPSTHPHPQPPPGPVPAASTPPGQPRTADCAPPRD